MGIPVNVDDSVTEDGSIPLGLQDIGVTVTLGEQTTVLSRPASVAGSRMECSSAPFENQADAVAKTFPVDFSDTEKSRTLCYPPELRRPQQFLHLTNTVILK